MERLYLFGSSDYALVEAYLFSKHYPIFLVVNGDKEFEQINQNINNSEELQKIKPNLQKIKILDLNEIEPESSDIFIFYDGRENDFKQLIGLLNQSQASLIDCSSYDWQLSRLKKGINPKNYYILAQYQQQGQLLAQLSQREHLIIGSHSHQKNTAQSLFKKIYSPFVSEKTKIKIGDLTSVYLSKFILNAHLAFRVTVMNEAAQIAELFSGNIETIRECISLDNRLGAEYLKAGCGFGGTSFMKDLQFLADILDKNQFIHRKLFKSALNSNSDQQEILFRKLWRHFEMDLENKKIAIWGLSYKPDTSDISQSPAIRVIQILLSQGAKVSCFDPLVKLVHLNKVFSKFELKKIEFLNSPIDCAKKTDAVLIFNELEIFKQVDLNELKQQMKTLAIFDGRNIFEPEAIKSLGFDYFSIGR